MPVPHVFPDEMDDKFFRIHHNVDIGCGSDSHICACMVIFHTFVPVSRKQKYKIFRRLQEKEQIFSPIKKRILLYIDHLGITKREFYVKTGISRGTMNNSTGITEDTLMKLLATYKNINPLWLITGIGNMVNDEEEHDEQTVREPKIDYEPSHYKEVINDLRKAIEILQDQLNESKKDRELLRKLLSEKKGK